MNLKYEYYIRLLHYEFLLEIDYQSYYTDARHILLNLR